MVSPRRRIRRHLLLARIAALACLSVSVPVAAKWGYGKVFFENEEFVLKALRIRTDGALSVARLAEIANVAPGMNLMDLDLSKIQGLISTLPQVEKATVTRELPDRLHVTVRERIPVAWLSSPPLGIRPWDMERGFLLDEEGYLFRCLDLNEGMKALPVVECFKMGEPVEGSRIDMPGVKAGLKLIVKSGAQLLEEGISLTGVRVRDEWAVECQFSNDLKATFAIHDFERGLKDLVLILDRMAEAGRSVTYANVAATKNIPVVLAALAPPAGDAGPELPAPLPTSAGSDAAGAVPPASAPAGAATAASGKASDESFGEPLAKVSAQEKHLRSILKGG